MYYENISAPLGYSIHLHTENPKQIIFPHWHHAIEINAVFMGSVTFFNNGTSQLVTANHLSITNSDVIHYSIPHYQHISNSLAGVTCIIQREWLEALIPATKDFDFSIIDKTDEEKIFTYIKDIAIGLKKENHEINTARNVLNICEILVTSCRIPKQKKVALMHDVLMYIHKNYQRKLTLESVAEEFGFSRAYFSRTFKKEVGVPFKQYINYYRLKISFELLEKNITLQEVTYHIGFDNESQFIRQFKQLFLMTPGEYRKQCHKSHIK